MLWKQTRSFSKNVFELMENPKKYSIQNLLLSPITIKIPLIDPLQEIQPM